MNIVFASPKGGVGKSTACLALATVFAKTHGGGAGITILDVDNNRTIERWSKRSGGYPGVTVQGCTSEQFNDTYDGAKAARPDDHLFIDLPGILDGYLFRAFNRADLVVIPAGLSEPDLREAAVLSKHLKGLATDLKRPIHSRLLLTRTRPVGDTKGAAFVRSEIGRLGLTAFVTPLSERGAYPDIFSANVMPHDRDPTDKAAMEIAALAAEVIEAAGAAEQLERRA